MKRIPILALAEAMTVAAMIASAAPLAPATAALSAKALFAGGCFWSIQSAFDKVYGVTTTLSGYAGGRTKNPTYETYEHDGHVETVLVEFDPSRVSLAELLDVYWRHSDPTDSGGAFYDRGPNYRPILFYYNDAQKAAIEKSKAELERSKVFGKPIVVEILPAPAFYPAEDYHQHYATENPEDYARYRVGSGRDAFFSRIWGKSALQDPGTPPSAVNGVWRKPDVAALKKALSPIQFEVTQKEGTEPPFQNEFWDEHRSGIYVDIVSGEALFSSADKFDSGTGWPSFTRPLVPSNIVEFRDLSYGMLRVETKSRYAGSHLGHLFDDGPVPTGLRYCMDSAALRFVPKANMEKEGYGLFLPHVD